MFEMLEFNATYVDFAETVTFYVADFYSLIDRMKDVLFIAWGLEPMFENRWKVDLATYKQCVFKRGESLVYVEYEWDCSDKITIRRF